MKGKSMDDYKTCDNCGDQKCVKVMKTVGADTSGRCEEHWKRMPCPFCGGNLSEIRTDGTKRWRHCYSCHFEFGDGKC